MARIGKQLATNPKLSVNIRQIIANDIRDDLIITPLYHEFLETWDESVPMWVANRISKIITRKARFRGGSWSASGAGMCMRRQELQFLNMPVTGSIATELRNIFLNGTWMHIRWQTILMTAGLLDNVEVTVKKPSIRARCSMDGVGTAKRSRFSGREFGFELKSRNDYEFRKQTMLGVDEKTRLQVDFEFMLSGLDVFVIMNENKNTNKPKEWVFYRSDERVNEMKKQVKELNRAIDNERLHPMLPECVKRDKNGEFYKCPFGGMGGACINSGKWPNKTGI